MGLGVISTVSLNVFGSMSWSTDFPAHMRNLIDQRKQLRNIVTIRSCQDRCQRNALSIGQEMVFTARFAPIRGIWAGFLAPARSTHGRAIHQSTRYQSIWCVARSSASNASKKRCQIP